MTAQSLCFCVVVVNLSCNQNQALRAQLHLDPAGPTFALGTCRHYACVKNNLLSILVWIRFGRKLTSKCVNYWLSIWYLVICFWISGAKWLDIWSLSQCLFDVNSFQVRVEVIQELWIKWYWAECRKTLRPICCWIDADKGLGLGGLRVTWRNPHHPGLLLFLLSLHSRMAFICKRWTAFWQLSWLGPSVHLWRATCLVNGPVRRKSS